MDQATRHPPFTIREWCEHNRVSRAFYYKLKSQGRAPKSYGVGSRQFISDEANAEWQRQQEACHV
jgi:hypothetical protein